MPVQPHNGAVSPEQASLVAEGLVSVTEAGRFLGLSRATIYVLMERGELPYCKIRGARRIPRKALTELAARNLIERA